eukprot:gnl/MRDRNA2_/MRDRNA2_136787_c0_seq1.p1 gnl/MRDRNA2_/MRDRNA2_136787_c0~~gnl/MRDRNA2_/MRDRNA2_136787_c0_seq1.p1  ORF type:complete len:184 (-),score=41.12 gnl/MRDRNA2_/MRDRNA2_136787_c0_seq1:122-673(-)
MAATTGIPADTVGIHTPSVNSLPRRTSKLWDTTMMDGKEERKSEATLFRDSLVGEYLRKHQAELYESVLKEAELELCKKAVMNALPVKNLFKLCDRDKSGAIDKDEIETVFRQLEVFAMDKMDSLFAHMDSNQIGELGFEDFVEWLLSTAEDCNAVERADIVIRATEDAVDRAWTKNMIVMGM